MRKARTLAVAQTSTVAKLPLAMLMLVSILALAACNSMGGGGETAGIDNTNAAAPVSPATSPETSTPSNSTANTVGTVSGEDSDVIGTGTSGGR